MKALQAILGIALPFAVGGALEQINESDVEIVVTEERSVFLPGESIAITVEVRNLSDKSILEPIAEDWEIEVRDASGVALESFASPPEQRVWTHFNGIPPEDSSTIEGGASSTREFRLQGIFLLQEEGAYTVGFSARIVQVVEGSSQPLGPFVRVESMPFAFEIDSSSVVWEQQLGPLVFNIVDEGGSLMLRFYRGSFSTSEDPFFSDYTVVGEVVDVTPAPELTESIPVAEWSGRVGVKFVAPAGTMCAVVEIEDDLVHFTPPVVIGSTESCPRV